MHVCVDAYTLEGSSPLHEVCVDTLMEFESLARGVSVDTILNRVLLLVVVCSYTIYI